MPSGTRHLRRKLHRDEFSQAKDILNRFPDLGDNGKCYGLTIKWMITDDFMRKFDDVKAGDNEHPLISSVISLNKNQSELSATLPKKNKATANDERTRMRTAGDIIDAIVDNNDFDRVLFENTWKGNNLGHATGLRVNREKDGSIRLKYFDPNTGYKEHKIHSDPTEKEIANATKWLAEQFAASDTSNLGYTFLERDKLQKLVDDLAAPKHHSASRAQRDETNTSVRRKEDSGLTHSTKTSPPSRPEIYTHAADLIRAIDTEVNNDKNKQIPFAAKNASTDMRNSLSQALDIYNTSKKDSKAEAQLKTGCKKAIEDNQSNVMAAPGLWNTIKEKVNNVLKSINVDFQLKTETNAFTSKSFKDKLCTLKSSAGVEDKNEKVESTTYTSRNSF